MLLITTRWKNPCGALVIPLCFHCEFTSMQRFMEANGEGSEVTDRLTKPTGGSESKDAFIYLLLVKIERRENSINLICVRVIFDYCLNSEFVRRKSKFTHKSRHTKTHLHTNPKLNTQIQNKCTNQELCMHIPKGNAQMQN